MRESDWSSDVCSSDLTVEFDVVDAITAVISATGTYGSVAIAFEATINGTNWFAVMGVQTDAAIFATASGTLSSTARAWEFGVSGFAKIRVRATAYTSGTMTITCGRSTLGYDPVGMNQVAIASGNVGVSSKTTGGATAAKHVSAATTNATSLKASAGTLYGGRAFNSGAGAAFLKFYDKASAPTVGTDVPVLVIGIPAGQSVISELGTASESTSQPALLTRLLEAMADNDTTAVALNQVCLAMSLLVIRSRLCCCLYSVGATDPSIDTLAPSARRGYQVSPVDPTIRTDMDSGPRGPGEPSMRETTRSNVVWAFSDEEMSAFRLWS
jgi:hypothetical protein